jgi:hypothetical protein
MPATTVLVRTPGRPSSPAATAGNPWAGTDWARLTRTPKCGGNPNVIQKVVVGDVTGDGLPEAVVLARCDASGGTPPSQLYVYTSGTTGAGPRTLATLLDGTEWQVGGVDVNGGQISVDGAKSSPTAPNCCPDIHRHLSWDWNGSAFHLRD